MRFEAWAAGLDKLMEFKGVVINPSPGLSGISIAVQDRGESSNVDLLASVASDEAAKLSGCCRSWLFP